MSINKQSPKKTAVKTLSYNKPVAPAKVFDVARPGKTAADNTSRPVIITNRPVIQDPMVTARTDSAESEISPTPALKPAKKLVITPLHSDVVPASTGASAPAAPTPQPIVSTEQVLTKKDPTPALVVSDIQAPIIPPPAAPAESVTEPGVPVNANDQTQVAPDDLAAQQRATELRQLINNERYFLPVNSVESKRSKRFAIVGLILIIVLAAAWYDVALDAGLVTNTYNLPHSTFLVKN